MVVLKKFFVGFCFFSDIRYFWGESDNSGSLIEIDFDKEIVVLNFGNVGKEKVVLDVF